MLDFSFQALWVSPLFLRCLDFSYKCLDIISEHSVRRNILQVLSPCSQESEVDLGENCLVIETEIAIKRGMAKLCKIRVHE